MFGPQPGQASVRIAVIAPAGPVTWKTVPHGHSAYRLGPTAAMLGSYVEYVPPQPIGDPW